MIFWLSFQSTQALKKDFDFFIFVKSRRDRAIFYFPWFSVFSENEILFIVLLLLAAISAPVNPERSSRPPPLVKLAWMFWPRDLLVISTAASKASPLLSAPASAPSASPDPRGFRFRFLGITVPASCIRHAWLRAHSSDVAAPGSCRVLKHTFLRRPLPPEPHQELEVDQPTPLQPSARRHSRLLVATSVCSPPQPSARRHSRLLAAPAVCSPS
jgi:hypothetical protein